MEENVLSSLSDTFFTKYNDIVVDDFTIEDICFIKSKKQAQILDQFDKYKKISKEETALQATKMVQTSNQVI